MLTNNYLSVLMCQLHVEFSENHKTRVHVINGQIEEEVKKAFEFMESKKPDITLFPEMSYGTSLDERYSEFSKDGKIVVAGSYYNNNGINTTVVFQDGKKFEFSKDYACGAEPMTRCISYVTPEEYFKTDLIKKHEFWIKGKKIYILNSQEYYHLAYYLARNPEYNADLFGIFAVCYNTNQHVFEEETVAIHNHNDLIYSFVLNGEGDAANGGSYIYGPVSAHEKEWCSSIYDEDIGRCVITKKDQPNHFISVCSRLSLFMYGEYIFPEYLTLFGRSDRYVSNPRNFSLWDV